MRLSRLALNLVIISLIVGANTIVAKSWGELTHEGIAREVGKVAQKYLNLSDTEVGKLSDYAGGADTNEADDGIGVFGIDEQVNFFYPLIDAIGAESDHWLDVWLYEHRISFPGVYCPFGRPSCAERNSGLR